MLCSMIAKGQFKRQKSHDNRRCVDKAHCSPAFLQLSKDTIAIHSIVFWHLHRELYLALLFGMQPNAINHLYPACNFSGSREWSKLSIVFHGLHQHMSAAMLGAAGLRLPCTLHAAMLMIFFSSQTILWDCSTAAAPTASASAWATGMSSALPKLKFWISLGLAAGLCMGLLCHCPIVFSI